MVQLPHNQDLPFVTGELTYSQPPAEGETLYFNVVPEILAPGEPVNNLVSIASQHEIRDIRGSEHRFSLETSGFQVILTPDTVAKSGNGSESKKEWTDPNWVKNIYEAEVERYLIEHTGATRVHIFDHTIRRRNNQVVKDTPETRQPVLRVHIDQTPASAVNRVKRHLGDDADELLKKRFALINVWRPLRGPVLDAPLALADYRTIDEKADLIPTELRRGPNEPSVMKVFLDNRSKFEYSCSFESKSYQHNF